MDKAAMLYFAAVNLAAFAAMGLDKRRAVRGGRRIPERSLLLLAALGGSPGAILGMLRFRHKTRRAKFSMGLPLMLVAQLAVGWALGLALARRG